MKLSKCKFEIEKISIAGDTDLKKGDIFPKDAGIIITYHTFKNN